MAHVTGVTYTPYSVRLTVDVPGWDAIREEFPRAPVDPYMTVGYALRPLYAPPAEELTAAVAPVLGAGGISSIEQRLMTDGCLPFKPQVVDTRKLRAAVRAFTRPAGCGREASPSVGQLK